MLFLAEEALPCSSELEALVFDEWFTGLDWLVPSSPGSYTLKTVLQPASLTTTSSSFLSCTIRPASCTLHFPLRRSLLSSLTMYFRSSDVLCIKGPRAGHQLRYFPLVSFCCYNAMCQAFSDTSILFLAGSRDVSILVCRSIYVNYADVHNTV